MRFYMLDRLQPIEKKIVLEYILDKYIVNEDGSPKEPDISDEDLLNGEHNIIDYFTQNFGLTKTPIYILNYKGRIYHRIYEIEQISKPKKAPSQNTSIRYFNSATKEPVSITIQKELENAFKITHHEVGIIDYKYCNHFGMINTILEEESPINGETPIKDYLGQNTLQVLH